MPLSDEQIRAMAPPHFQKYTNVVLDAFAGAIESAATAPLLAQIAELEAKDSVSTVVLQMKRIAQLEAQLLEAREALAWCVEQGGGPVCEHESGGAVCFCKENQAIAAIDAAIAQEQK